MTEHVPFPQPFVVRLDRATVIAKRAGARRANRVSLGISIVGGVILLALGVLSLAWALTSDGSLVLGLIGVAGLAFLGGAVAQARVLRRARPWYEATDLPDEIIRMTPDGMQLGSESAAEPVWLPWPAVAGFRYGQSFGQPILTLLLTPGVTPATPGVRGLDQPEVASAFGPGRRRRGIFYGLAALDQSVEAIDAAMRSFTNGRAGVLR